MWLPAETARLHELIIDPVRRSCSQMATVLNKEFHLQFTRNAIIGKIHRMHWERDRPAISRPPPMPRKRKLTPRGGVTAFNGFQLKNAEPPSPVPSTPVLDLHIPAGQRRSISELENGFCRYPVGEPGKEGFFFCGGRTWGERPYCRKHWAIAHRREVRR